MEHLPNPTGAGVARWLWAVLLVSAAVFGASDYGPAIGSRFPAANMQTGPKGAAVLLYPPGTGREDLAELDKHRGEFQKLGVGVATLTELAGQPARRGWFVLDAKRTIVAKYFDDNDGYTSAAILVHQFGWTPTEPAIDVEGKQLTASLHASNPTVAPGERIALLIDVDLAPNMHVYAPGVEGYIPIEWKMDDFPAAQAQPAEFPHAEKLYLKAIDETVPAYRNHFRLVRDIKIAPEDKLKAAADSSGRVTVKGSLRYQACDDRVCYIPQTLHLEWPLQRR